MKWVVVEKICDYSSGIVAENFDVFENDIFDCKVLWMVGWMEICSLFRSVTFVVRFLGRFLGRDVFLAFQMLKSESSLQMRISIRNWEDETTFFTCCGWEDECSKQLWESIGLSCTLVDKPSKPLSSQLWTQFKQAKMKNRKQLVTKKAQNKKKMVSGPSGLSYYVVPLVVWVNWLSTEWMTVKITTTLFTLTVWTCTAITCCTTGKLIQKSYATWL